MVLFYKKMNENSKIPRIMLAAPASGSGKTMITCGLIKVIGRYRDVAAFKCGPDYIDPMFHRTVLNTPSMNLDSFLSGSDIVKGNLIHGCTGGKDHAGISLAVLEGVMGFYDGLGGTSLLASSYEISRITGTPVILVLNAKGMSLSALALIRGFMDFKADSNIKGVILNRTSKSVYERLAPVIEQELHIKACGYVPETEGIRLPGRHLGLVMPSEISDIEERISAFSDLLNETLDIEKILEIADETFPVDGQDYLSSIQYSGKEKINIGVARDEAFCFYYRENLDILEASGADLIYFSPLHDSRIPDDADALYMGGGYPEYYAGELSSNISMMESIKRAVDQDMPVLAECGSYMYLHEELQGMDDRMYPGVGIFTGKAVRCGHLVRFGYHTLTSVCDTVIGSSGKNFNVHEFHYYDTTEAGDAFIAERPTGGDKYTCMKKYKNLLGGFPHFYFAGDISAAQSFVKAGSEYRNRKGC